MNEDEKKVGESAGEGEAGVQKGRAKDWGYKILYCMTREGARIGTNPINFDDLNPPKTSRTEI